MTRRTSEFKILLLIVSLGLSVGWSDQKETPADHTVKQPAASAEEVSPLLIGANVPNLTLKPVKGEPFDLNAAIARQPTILIFYRGGW